jgi:hypothetical protein
MAQIDNYQAFEGLNLSDARMENETREEYKNRLKANKKIMKIYFKVGREAFKEMFPNGVTDALLEAEAVYNENNSKTSMKKLGEAK